MYLFCHVDMYSGYSNVIDIQEIKVTNYFTEVSYYFRVHIVSYICLHIHTHVNPSWA